MGQLTEADRNLQKHYATRAIAVRYTNQRDDERSKWMYDNQWIYKKKRLRGYDAKHWETKLTEYIRKNLHLIREASLHDVTQSSDLTIDNRIAQVVSNGHFLI